MATSPTDSSHGRKDSDPPPGARWIQALCIVAAVATAALDAFVPDFTPPRELYALFGAGLLGLGAEDAVKLVAAWRKR